MFSFCSLYSGKRAHVKLLRPSDFVRSTEGHEVQQKLWHELVEILEKANPGIVENV